VAERGGGEGGGGVCASAAGSVAGAGELVGEEVGKSGSQDVGKQGRAYFYLPWQRHFDFSLIKQTKITESINLEFRSQALNIFNLSNFVPNNNIGSSFGQTTTAYRDSSGTVDPGGRILEFVFRLKF
jgi:hypothetical protein